MSYTHLTEEERYQIHAMIVAGSSVRAIADSLQRSPSTISREVRRNCGQRGYRPKQAHTLARGRARACRQRPRITLEQWRQVSERLRDGWSPEEIAGRARLEDSLKISHEWIYQFVYADKSAGGGLHTNLRCQKQRRKRYGSGRQRRGQIADRVGIEERPASVNDRSEIGHWEADTIRGKNQRGSCVTVVERMSRFTRLGKLNRSTAKKTAERLRKRLQPFADVVSSITSDNGKEFTAHRQISQSLDCEFYFADPYASWQRGTNENTNGLIRQYLPKSRDLRTLTGSEIRMIENRLNHRPRKCLGYLTPHEVLYNERLEMTVALRS